MLVQSIESPEFTFTQLLPGVVICEASFDIYGWNNATERDPAFLVYLGYNIPLERDEWLARLRSIWKVGSEIVDRPSQRVNSYWHELKLRGIQRHSDPDVFHLDYLSESKQYGLDFLVYMQQMKLAGDEYEAMTVTSSLLH
jgi:hypothetical protein